MSENIYPKPFYVIQAVKHAEKYDEEGNRTHIQEVNLEDPIECETLEEAKEQYEALRRFWIWKDAKPIRRQGVIRKINWVEVSLGEVSRQGTVSILYEQTNLPAHLDEELFGIEGEEEA